MRRLMLLSGLVMSLASIVAGQTNPSDSYDREEARISMRDGVKLYTEIYTPRDAKDPLPILFVRTPYDATGTPRRLDGPYLRELATEQYVFVFQDIRGRYKSEGAFVMMRPPRDKNNPQSIDEGTDTYDTIEWLLHNVPKNNGRVGMLGISYPGWLTVMATLDPHPALKAASPQASPGDMFIGDDFHHNGAFRLSYGFEFAFMLEASTADTMFVFDNYDTYEWYLNLGPLRNADKRYFKSRIPTWTNFTRHPNYDEFWKKQSVIPYLTRVTVPTLHVAGWWDQEDFYGPLKIYEELERHDMENKNFFVAGPWNHGGWAGARGDKLGNVDFDSTAPSLFFREKIQAPWFAFYLKDEGELKLPEAMTFQTGANKWMSYETWPPRMHFAEKKLYLRADGQLSFAAPQREGADEFDSYVSDPHRPVPYRSRPIEATYGRGSRWYTWLTEDQRFVHMRPDVLSWETGPLQEDVVITGKIMGRLFASTSGTDADWIVKLIDVYPVQYDKNFRMAGYQLMVAADVLRGRFRNSFEKPKPIKPNEVNEYAINLNAQDYRFLKGHRIMVQVQSTWFPIIDRNPQKYIENIFEASESDFQSATQKIYRSKQYPSHLRMSVME